MATTMRKLVRYWPPRLVYVFPDAGFCLILDRIANTVTYHKIQEDNNA